MESGESKSTETSRICFPRLLASLIVAITTLILPLMPLHAERQIFATWDTFEVDKVASIWLIKRYIDPEALVLIYPKGTLIKEGIQFDTPYAKIRRRYNQSTFEYLLGHYKLEDSKLNAMGKIVHDIEINTWEKKVYPKSSEVRLAIGQILKESKDMKTILRRSLEYFDSLYESLPIDSELE